jgi:hypothetical protein
MRAEPADSPASSRDPKCISSGTTRARSEYDETGVRTPPVRSLTYFETEGWMDYDDDMVTARRSDGASTVATAVLVGAALGAAIALLFAPRPGAETRRQLRRTADRLKDRAGSMLEDTNHSLAREIRRRGRRMRRTLERLG